MEKFTSSSSQEETEHEYKLPLRSERNVYAKEKRQDAEEEDCKLSSCSVNPDCPATQSEYGEETESVVNGESVKVHTVKGMRKRKNGGDTCPTWPKRLKESSQLEDHVRIHTGERLYQCKQCGINLEMSIFIK